MSLLFTPIKLRDLEIPNRLWMAPMCMYSARDGLPGLWHQTHYASRAAGGAGLIITEATAVRPDGRITPQCAGIWNDRQTHGWRSVVSAVHACRATIAVQLAHAGRKGSSYPPGHAEGSVPLTEGGWQTLGPTSEPFPGYAAPVAASRTDLEEIRRAFEVATDNAAFAGFDVAEIHAAHGYLLHEFLSPLVNTRTDEYGGTLENRMRFPLEVVDAVRKAWPEERPLLIRISAVDWVAGGLSVEDQVVFADRCADLGVDLVDVSSGAAVPEPNIPLTAGYQVGFAAQIREQARVATSAVGLIRDPRMGERIIGEAKADAVLLGRPLLTDPYLPHRWHTDLDHSQAVWPFQYRRGL